MVAYFFGVVSVYRPVPGEDLVIDNAGIFLLDSGAQYRYVGIT